MSHERFSELIPDNGSIFTVRGDVDFDGLPVIDTVECADSLFNIWPCIDDSKLADRLDLAVKEILARQAALPMIDDYAEMMNDYADNPTDEHLVLYAEPEVRN